MTTYLCLLHYDVSAVAGLSPADHAALAAECQPHDRTLQASGHLRTVATLDEVARTVRHRGGTTTTTDGYLLAGNTQVGAYLLLEAADLDAAARVAALHPAAQTGEDLGWAVEVRPIDFYLAPPREPAAAPANYLCLGYYDPAPIATMSPAQLEALGAACRPHDEALGRTGQLVAAASLAETARTIKRRRGKVEFTDGPYVEAKEMVGSFLLLAAADLDDAVRVASLHPAARMGEELGWALEIRPIERAISAPAP
jgi:hypothetical protein